jgi:hypothetical protein
VLRAKMKRVQREVDPQVLRSCGLEGLFVVDRDEQLQSLFQRPEGFVDFVGEACFRTLKLGGRIA